MNDSFTNLSFSLLEWHGLAFLVILDINKKKNKKRA